MVLTYTGATAFKGPVATFQEGMIINSAISSKQRSDYSTQVVHQNELLIRTLAASASVVWGGWEVQPWFLFSLNGRLVLPTFPGRCTTGDAGVM